MPQTVSQPTEQNPGSVYTHFWSRNVDLLGEKPSFFKSRTRTRLQVPVKTDPPRAVSHSNARSATTDSNKVSLKRLDVMRFSKTNKTAVTNTEARFSKVGVNVSFKGRHLYGIKVCTDSKEIKKANGRFSSACVHAYIPLATLEEIETSNNPETFLANRFEAYQNTCKQEKTELDLTKDAIFLRRNSAKFKSVAYPLIFIPVAIAAVGLTALGFEACGDCGGGDCFDSGGGHYSPSPTPIGGDLGLGGVGHRTYQGGEDARVAFQALN